MSIRLQLVENNEHLADQAIYNTIDAHKQRCLESLYLQYFVDKNHQVKIV